MALRDEDKLKLKAVGFTAYEIGEFSKATDPSDVSQPLIDLDSPLWQRVMDSRRKWVDDKINRGWTEFQIENAFDEYYRKGKEPSPWDFLKAEYKPPLKRDYYEGVRARKQRLINAELGKYY